MKPLHFIITMACLLLAGLIFLGIGDQFGCLIFALIALCLLLAQVSSGGYAAGVRKEVKAEIKPTNNLTDDQRYFIANALRDAFPAYYNEYFRIYELMVRDKIKYPKPFFENMVQHDEFHRIIAKYFNDLRMEIPSAEELKDWQP